MTQLAPSDPRAQQLSVWLNDVYRDQKFTIKPLCGDASFRRYLRLYLDTPNDDGNVSVNANVSANDNTNVNVKTLNSPTASQNRTNNKVFLIMDAPPDKESVTEFVTIAELMSEVVNVPSIIAQDIDKGFLVLHDFGKTEFGHLIADATAEQVDDYYYWAMQTLIALQSIDIDYARHKAHIPDYDAKMLKTEMSLFTEWFLPYIGLSLAGYEQVWQKFIEGLVQQISRQPKVLVHRDFHSRNLMRDQDNPEKLGVIDFQDAVIGAYSYDLVSLLRDAYVRWDESQIESWITQYWYFQQDAGLNTASSVDGFMKDVNIMGLQRHLKVLGIFVRLAQRDGKLRYLADLPKVMTDLCAELVWLEQHSDLQDQDWFKDFYNWINDRVLPQFEKIS